MDCTVLIVMDGKNLNSTLIFIRDIHVLSKNVITYTAPSSTSLKSVESQDLTL